MHKQCTSFGVFIVQEMIFSGVVIMCYLFSGIACTIYAANWGKPPDVCQTVDNISDDDQDDLCDSIPLSVTNGLEAVSAFVVSPLGLFCSCFPGILFLANWSRCYHCVCDTAWSGEEKP